VVRLARYDAAREIQSRIRPAEEIDLVAGEIDASQNKFSNHRRGVIVATTG
jgi:hypothetical protein